MLRNDHIWKHWGPTSGSVSCEDHLETCFSTSATMSCSVERTHGCTAAHQPYMLHKPLCYYSYAHNICTYSLKRCSGSPLLPLQKQGTCVSVHQDLDKPDPALRHRLFFLDVPVCLLGRSNAVNSNDSISVLVFFCISYFSTNHTAVYNCGLGWRAFPGKCIHAVRLLLHPPCLIY